MSYFNRVTALATFLVLVICYSAMAQSPPIPGKSPEIPGKSTPLASPQAAFASPQQSFVPQYEQPAVVLRAVPQVYAVNRVVLAAPVACAPVASYALADVGCGVGVQQAVVQRSFIQHQAVVNHGFQNAVVNHGVVAGAGRQPRKIITKQKTRLRGRLR